MQAPAAWRESLAALFSRTPEVALAWVFGSAAAGRMRDDSDVDVAVYFFPDSAAIDIEEPEAARPDVERRLWTEAEKIVERDVDLVILNRVPATLASAVVEQGLLLVNKNPALGLRLALAFSSIAEDIRALAREFREIKQRSRSLNEADRDRLVRAIDFLEAELADSKLFHDMTRKDYETDSSRRRNVERWVENVVNSSIEMAKIMLASQQTEIPQTYRQVLHMLAIIPGVGQELADTLADFSKLRNILAHQYIDVRWSHISRFVREGTGAYARLGAAAQAFLATP